MATYYAIGIVNKFEAKVQPAIEPAALEEVVGARLDFELFDLSHADGKLAGTLKSGLFERHIESFVDRLNEIVPDNESTIRFCFESYGTDIDKYNLGKCRFRLLGPAGQLIDVRAQMVLVFLEGKVLAECFSVEPILINWLFRHSDFGNPLAGIIMSGIVG